MFKLILNFLLSLWRDKFQTTQTQMWKVLITRDSWAQKTVLWPKSCCSWFGKESCTRKPQKDYSEKWKRYWSEKFHYSRLNIVSATHIKTALVWKNDKEMAKKHSYNNNRVENGLSLVLVGDITYIVRVLIIVYINV